MKAEPALPVRPRGAPPAGTLIEDPVMSLSRTAPADQPNDARLNELLQQFRDAEDYDIPPGLVGGRDGGGRFTKSNRGGPGNPYNRRVAELCRIMLEEVSDDAMRGIIQVLLHKAQTGDLAAIKLVLQYVLGKPTPAPDPDAVEQHERQPEEETPRQVDPEPRRSTSKRPQRETAEPRASKSATQAATDANGDNGDNGEPLTDTNGETATRHSQQLQVRRAQ
jgi:hypothetical protein